MPAKMVVELTDQKAERRPGHEEQEKGMAKQQSS